MKSGTLLHAAPAPQLYVPGIIGSALQAADAGKSRQPWVAADYLLEHMSAEEVREHAPMLRSFWSVVAVDLGYGQVFKGEEDYEVFIGSLCAMLAHPGYVRATSRRRRVRFGGPSKPAVWLDVRTASVVGLLGKFAKPQLMMVKADAA